MVEVILFLGVAAAGTGNALGYLAGEKHPVLLFVRQPRGSEPNFAAAAAELERCGWFNVALSRASSISVESLNSSHPHAAASYEEALNTGFAALVFSEEVK